MKNIVIKLLNVDECYMLNKRLIDVFETDLQKESSVAAVLPHLNELTADLFAILANKNDSNSLTKQLAEEDKARDAAFISFRDYSKSFLREPNPIQSAAAEGLTELIQKVGWTLYNHGYTEQTAAEETLIEKLAEPEYVKAVKAIKAEDRVLNLQETNARFEKTLKLKTDAEARGNISTVYDCRSRIARYLKPLLVYLELMADVSPETYALAATRIDESIEYVLTVAKARHTRKENQQVEGEDDPETTEPEEPETATETAA